MRKPIDDSINEDKDLNNRANIARSLTKNASVKTKESDSENKENIELILGEVSKFNKSSEERKIFSFKVNLYQKAALYIYSKKHKISMQESLERSSLNQILESSEKDGLNEEIVKNLHRRKLIK